MLTRVLARELASSNIDVNELVPGPVATSILATQAAGAHLKSPSMGEEWFKTPEDLLPLAMGDVGGAEVVAGGDVAVRFVHRGAHRGATPTR